MGLGGRSADGVFPGAYLVQNVFFRTNWPDDELAANDTDVQRLDLLTLRKTRREQEPFPHYARSKYAHIRNFVSLHRLRRMGGSKGGGIGSQGGHTPSHRSAPPSPTVHSYTKFLLTLTAYMG